MGNGRAVGDHRDTNAGGLDGTHGRLTTSASTLHAHFAFGHALGIRRAGGILRDHRRGKRRALAAALETGLAGRAPGNHTTAGIRNRHLRVVESGTDEGNSRRNRLARTPLLGSRLAFGSLSCRIGLRRGRSRRGFLLDVFFAH